MLYLNRHVSRGAGGCCWSFPQVRGSGRVTLGQAPGSLIQQLLTVLQRRVRILLGLGGYRQGFVYEEVD